MKLIMRQVFEESTKNILKELSSFIKEYTDFGLEIWVERLKNHTNETLHLPANLLFRQVLEMTDAISELIGVGYINASKPLIRSSLDCYLQLAYLLKDNEEEKASFFLYHYNLKKYNSLVRMIFPERDNSFNSKLIKDQNLQGFELSESELKLTKIDLENLKATLNSDENKMVASQYDSKTRRSWYESLLGYSTIEQLAIHLEEPGLYELLYRDLSEFSHGTDIVHNNVKLISADYWGVIALRDVSDLKNIVDTTILILEKTILTFLKSKISNLNNFKKGLELADRANRLRQHQFTSDKESLNN